MEIETKEMNNQVAKKSKKKLFNMQNILAFFIVLAIILVISTILEFVGTSAGSADRFAEGLGVALSMLYFAFFITILVVVMSLVKGVGSLRKIAKNKGQITTLELEKAKKKWLIFDVVSFLIIPIVFVALFIGLGKSSYIFYIVLFIISAIGIQTLIRNRNGSVSSRMSGWILTILGIFPLIIAFLAFLFPLTL